MRGRPNFSEGMSKMRFVLIVLILASGMITDATADSLYDCLHETDLNLKIHACTELVEGRARGGKLCGYINRSSAYFENGDYDHAIPDYEALIRLKPSDAIG